ncbi:hypothetical protein CONPUDRAFT_143455 [Coniophora puteana RWD-64-598 SS2]|uniref:F-box domain-containing protein n=1 Tax=Coniophora puteana (strain RWD-64-598) TaxID=741705 RepID=A0A5M3MTA0_CONPW|nr:uncharacterized protein CONPUDRAFT_143455 [Coniophora puteana RWD-64-598 SS2]EIW81751.1 hypothetical protein CONPUDRAFT_143455 [Coniophora puteana RWD-64-598 SS2]
MLSLIVIPSQDTLVRLNTMQATRRLTIHHLPADVILFIFRSLYDSLHEMKQNYDIRLSHQTIAEEDVSWDTRDPTFWRWKDEHVLMPSIFPYACARVCMQWRDLIAGVSAFWTRVIIILDAPHFSASWVRWLLERSRNHPIQVWVTRMNKQPNPVIGDGSVEERVNVKMALECLQPHLVRCRMLCFNVLCRSSIVAACYRLSGEAPALRSLVLNSRVTDTVAPSSRLRHLTCNLTHLTVDAKSFTDIRKYRDWGGLSAYASRHLSIRITAYTLSDGPTSFVSMKRLILALRRMPRCDSLTIKDVCFRPTDTTANDLGVVLGIDLLNFENLEGTAVRDFFANTITHPESTSITRCSLAGEWTNPVEGQDLAFIDIGADEKTALAGALRYWDNQFLHFVRCPAVDDAFLLDTVAQLPELSILYLTECEFTPGVLRTIVERRAADENLSRMTEFEVACPGVEMPQDLRAWAKAVDMPLLWSAHRPSPGYDYDGYFRGVRPEECDDEDFYSYLNEE